jgi:hypothetical protein
MQAVWITAGVILLMFLTGSSVMLFHLWMDSRKERKERARLEKAADQQIANQFVKELAELRLSIEKVNPDAVNGLLEFVEGLKEMCKELCRTNDAFLKAMETFQRSIDGSSYTTGDPNVDDETDEEGERRRLLRKGVPEVEVESRIREANLYRSLRR